MPRLFAQPERSLGSRSASRCGSRRTAARGGRARLRNRSSNRGALGASGAGTASATSRREPTTRSTILDASGSLTGVEAVHTVPVQWLNTMVEEAGCHVTRRKRSPPRASLNVSVRARSCSTKPSMHLTAHDRYAPRKVLRPFLDQCGLRPTTTSVSPGQSQKTPSGDRFASRDRTSRAKSSRRSPKRCGADHDSER
jgi:hypothetical protein